MQVVCCPYPCAVEYAKTQEAKREQSRQRRAEARKFRQESKTLSQLRKEAQLAFNAYIRERDKRQPCISCGAVSLNDPLTGGAWDCGHFLGIGAHSELRYEPLNAHKQCKRCNRDLSGNHGHYRKNLIERIGLEQVEWLEGPHEIPKYSREELIEIRKKFVKMKKDLDET